MTLVVTSVFGSHLSFAQVSGEYQLKSVFLINFVRLIDWPVTLEDANVFNLCSIKNSKINPSLTKFQGKVAKNKKINIRLIDSLDNADECSLLFLEDSNDQLVKLPGMPVNQQLLLVSDSEGFADCLGHIELAVDKNKSNKLALRINKQNVERDGFRVSSRILIRSTVLDSTECKQ